MEATRGRVASPDAPGPDPPTDPKRAGDGASGSGTVPPPPPPRTKWTRLVHPSVLIGHAAGHGRACLLRKRAAAAGRFSCCRRAARLPTSSACGRRQTGGEIALPSGICGKRGVDAAGFTPPPPYCCPYPCPYCTLPLLTTGGGRSWVSRPWQMGVGGTSGGGRNEVTEVGGAGERGGHVGHAAREQLELRLVRGEGRGVST